jgi:hypothetical protein
LGLLVVTQAPDTGLQVEVAWQGFVVVQVTGVPETQLPAWQTSPMVQALPSSQEVPGGRGTRPQLPVAGSQTPL